MEARFESSNGNGHVVIPSKDKEEINRGVSVLPPESRWLGVLKLALELLRQTIEEEQLNGEAPIQVEFCVYEQNKKFSYTVSCDNWGNREASPVDVSLKEITDDKSHYVLAKSDGVKKFLTANQNWLDSLCKIHSYKKPFTETDLITFCRSSQMQGVIKNAQINFTSLQLAQAVFNTQNSMLSKNPTEEELLHVIRTAFAVHLVPVADKPTQAEFSAAFTGSAGSQVLEFLIQNIRGVLENVAEEVHFPLLNLVYSHLSTIPQIEEAAFVEKVLVFRELFFDVHAFVDENFKEDSSIKIIIEDYLYSLKPDLPELTLITNKLQWISELIKAAVGKSEPHFLLEKLCEKYMEEISVFKKSNALSRPFFPSIPRTTELQPLIIRLIEVEQGSEYREKAFKEIDNLGEQPDSHNLIVHYMNEQSSNKLARVC